MYIYKYTFIVMYTRMYIYTCIHIHIYIYVYTYIHIRPIMHIHTTAQTLRLKFSKHNSPPSILCEITRELSFEKIYYSHPHLNPDSLVHTLKILHMCTLSNFSIHENSQNANAHQTMCTSAYSRCTSAHFSEVSSLESNVHILNLHIQEYAPVHIPKSQLSSRVTYGVASSCSAHFPKVSSLESNVHILNLHIREPKP